VIHVVGNIKDATCKRVYRLSLTCDLRMAECFCGDLDAGNEVFQIVCNDTEKFGALTVKCSKLLVYFLQSCIDFYGENLLLFEFFVCCLSASVFS